MSRNIFTNLVNSYNLSYFLPNGTKLFENISCNFSGRKIGLVGKNGTGKTTLLRLIVGEILPASGNIEYTGSISYCQQLLDDSKDITVAHMLGVHKKIAALNKINHGSVDAADFDVLGDDWDILDRTRIVLDDLNLQHISWQTPSNYLSGGERTKLSLAKAFLSNTDTLILDEPTNNLDKHAKDELIALINNTDKNFLIVSHDRAFLNHMESIVELTSIGIKSYGGNFTFYKQQKDIEQAAIAQELLDAQKQVKSAKQSMQQTREKLEQRKSKGRKEFLKGNIDKLSANSKKGRSEKTQSKDKTTFDNLQENANKVYLEVKDKLENIKHLKLDLSKTFISNNKKVLEIENLSFNYANQEKEIIKDFSLNISGPDRVAILGKNGAGKSTLLKLILGNPQPSSGTISVGEIKIQYLDQRLEILNQDLSILDNFLHLNPEVSIKNAHFALADFLFRNKDAHKLIADLSGGEKLRAAMACVLMSETPPQCLILDEPTNHLDLDSIAIIESALCQYQGALLVVSHDSVFLEKININSFVELTND